MEAGFGRDLPGDPPTGFAAVGPLDGLAPGQVLAGFAGEAFAAGFGNLSMGFTGIAGSMTTRQLRAALQAMVLALNPDAARDRAENGRSQARVEIWPESSGNSGIAGRELPAAEVIVGDVGVPAGPRRHPQSTAD